MRLSQATLDAVADHAIVPAYDRTGLRPRIVHIGPGNFHRVHQAVYLDRLLAGGHGEDWGICAVELLDSPDNRARADAYRAQDTLYTVTEIDNDASRSVRVVGAIVEYLHAPADRDAVLARIADPDTRIVSLTITEGGYNIDETTGAFDLAAPAVAAELAGGPPTTAFGYIVHALRRRHAAGTGPFAVMSCDNLRSNGDTARLSIMSFARALDPALAGWIEANVTFPNSMVDRIAPRVTAQTRDALNLATGIADAIPVFSEAFSQWVIEDRFATGRPAWPQVGVQVRDDVHAFEAIKGRMLNASHGMMAVPALLLGYRTVHDGMTDPRLRQLLEVFLTRDVIPRLSGPPDVSLTEYKDAVIGRFANPNVVDQILRIVADNAARLPTFHTVTIERLLADGADPVREAFLLAGYRRSLRGLDDYGAAYPIDEPHLADDDRALILDADPVATLRSRPFARMRLWEESAFLSAYLEQVTAFEAGTAAALARPELGLV